MTNIIHCFLYLHATKPEPTIVKSCPFCYRLIPENAKMCMYCGGEFPDDNRYHFAIYEHSFAPGVCKVSVLIQSILFLLQIILFSDLQQFHPSIALPPIFTVFITILFLFYDYRRQPIVMVKNELEIRQKEISSNIRQEKTELNTSQLNVNNIEENRLNNLSDRKKNYQKTISNLDDEWHSIIESEKKDIDNRLRLFQQIHFSESLENISLEKSTLFNDDNAHWKNILLENEITCAAQIKPEILDTKIALDDTIKLILLGWRQEIEKDLISNQTTVLPRKTINQIKEKYILQKKSILKQKNIAFSSYKKDMANIDQQTSQMLIDISIHESELKESLELHTEKMKVLSFKLEKIKHYHFRDFVLSSISFAASSTMIPKQVFRVFLILMLFILPFLQIPFSILTVFTLF